jgi:hypothetical protein
MHPDDRDGFVEDIWWGVGVGLLLGVPAGIMLKVADYPSDALAAWWTFLVVTYVGLLVAAAVLATRRFLQAAGLVTGLTLSIGLAPLAVVVDIVTNSQ